MLVDLNPILLEFGPFTVRWYGFLMALSMGIGAFYFLKHGKRQGFDEDFLLNLAILALIGGVVGARFIFVITNWGYFSAYPTEIIRIDHGGLSYHGGLLGGVLATLPYIRKKKASFGALADLTIPGLTVGYILVRIANIFNQEVLGRETIFFAFDRHPAQIYGSLIGLTLLLLHNYLARKEHGPGYLFWSFLFYYSLLRGVVEETVRENPIYLNVFVSDYWGVGFFTLTQLITPALMLFAYWMMRKTKSA